MGTWCSCLQKYILMEMVTLNLYFLERQRIAVNGATISFNSCNPRLVEARVRELRHDFTLWACWHLIRRDSNKNYRSRTRKMYNKPKGPSNLATKLKTKDTPSTTLVLEAQNKQMHFGVHIIQQQTAQDNKSDGYIYFYTRRVTSSHTIIFHLFQEAAWRCHQKPMLDSLLLTAHKYVNA